MAGIRSFIRNLSLMLVACISLAHNRVEACMVCIDVPEETVTDQLIDADVVVLARENPTKPYSYLATDVLKGQLDDPAIDLFVNSGTRQRLVHNPTHSVVLTFDQENGQWRSGNYATPAYQAFIREILAQAPSWPVFDRREKRPSFFLPYLSHDESAIRELAYLEVGQASYDLIRRADDQVPPVQVHEFLADPAYIEWHPLYILLLGVEATQDDARMIRQTIEGHAKYGLTLNLAAWATALIESGGAGALDWLVDNYLDDNERTADEVLAVIKACSVQGTRLPALRPKIAEGYASMLANHPTLAGWAARDLAVWNDWRFAERFDSLRESEVQMDGATMFSVNYYIKRARRINRGLGAGLPEQVSIN